MLHHVVFLSNVTPGPACAIPEEKKIFRVTIEDTGAVPFNRPSATGDCLEEAANENPPLPVPHMYSA
jgi:hypothetical protein